MRIKPEIIIHNATLTDVDRCERERELVYKMNVEGTRIVSQASKLAGSFLIYIYPRIMSSMEAEESHADYISLGDARDHEFAHNLKNSVAAARLWMSFPWLCAFITARGI